MKQSILLFTLCLTSLIGLSQYHIALEEDGWHASEQGIIGREKYGPARDGLVAVGWYITYTSDNWETKKYLNIVWNSYNEIAVPIILRYDSALIFAKKFKTLYDCDEWNLQQERIVTVNKQYNYTLWKKKKDSVDAEKRVIIY